MHIKSSLTERWRFVDFSGSKGKGLGSRSVALAGDAQLAEVKQSLVSFLIVGISKLNLGIFSISVDYLVRPWNSTNVYLTSTSYALFETSFCMSYLLHGSTAHTLMGWVDRVPRAGNLFIGGLYALYQTDLIKAAGITHVLSVIDYDPLLQEKFSHLKHFHIRADDDPNADLLQHFEKTNAYIDEGLKDGGVFVHCAMGKSRSATLVVAFLMWKYGVGWQEALEQLCEGRPVCDPNPGFKEQLEVWQKMLQTEDEVKKKRIYENWDRTKFRGEWWEWEARAKREEVDKARL